MTVQEFVYIDKDLQTVLDISDVNIIILIYLFIKHVLFILVFAQVQIACHNVSRLKVYLFIWLHNFRFSMSLSLSPNSLYRQTTDCTEGGGLTREHCISFSMDIQNVYISFSMDIQNVYRITTVLTAKTQDIITSIAASLITKEEDGEPRQQQKMSQSIWYFFS